MTQKGTATELGNQPIGKLLTQYAIPAIIAMTASSLYNMVDSIFIGHGVGAMAISGLAITFPLMNLAAAFGSLVGVGASTLVSVKLGQKDYSTAQQILGNVVSLNLIIGILFTILTLAFLDPILYFFGASEVTLPYARDYMVTILLGNVVTHMYLGLNSVLRSAGHPQKAMAATILTVVINTLLDPLFIYGFGMGIRGAAIATILAQIISLCWLIKIFCNKNELLHFRRGIYRLKGVLVENIIGIGVLYGRESLLEKMPPFLTGGEMIDSVTRDKVIYSDLPHKFEAGTVNAAGAWGLKTAIEYIQNIGFDTIGGIEEELTERAFDGLMKIPHINIQGSNNPKEHCGIISFTIDGVHPHDVSSILDADGIAVRAGHHCAQPLMEFLGIPSTTRASIYFYNTKDDIDAFLNSVSSVRRRMGYGK